MRQLSALDAQFLNVESPTTGGHVGSLVVLDPSTAPGGRWDLESVRAVLEPRLHLTAPFRQRLAQVPLGLGRAYWVDDPHFDIEFHLRELALPSPGTREQLTEQVARIHGRQLDRSRPLWEAYVITGLEDGRGAFYSKIHHAAIDGISGAEILETLMDVTAEPREVPPEDDAFVPRPMPSGLNLVGRGITELALNPLEAFSTLPRSLPYVDRLPGATNFPGARLFSESASLVGMALGGPLRSVPETRVLHAPRTPLNGTITAHRRFAYGSLPLSDVKLVKNHFGMTVNDVVMALAAAALRRWLLDHDALPGSPLVAAVPVSIREKDSLEHGGNQVSVMLAELPTHLRDAEERMQFMRASMLDAKRAFDAVPASLLQDLSTLIPTALSGLAARALFKLATVPGVPFNLFISNVPGPQLPLYVAGARVEGIYPVSAVTDLTGGLNITLFSYDGALDFGLIACREMVPDVWNLIGYLHDAMAEMVALVPEGAEDSGTSKVPGATGAPQASGGPGPAAKKPRSEGSAGGKDRGKPAARRGSGARKASARAAVDAGAKTASRPKSSPAKGTAAKGTAVKGPAVKGPAVKGPAVKGTAAKGTAAKRTTAKGTAAKGRPTEAPESRKSGRKASARKTSRPASEEPPAPARRAAAKASTPAPHPSSTQAPASSPATRSSTSATKPAATKRTRGPSKRSDKASGSRAAQVSAKKASQPRKSTAVKKASPAPRA